MRLISKADGLRLLAERQRQAAEVKGQTEERQATTVPPVTTAAPATTSTVPGAVTPPGQVGVPTAERVDDPAGGIVTVGWSPPGNGGSPITGYQVLVYDEGVSAPVNTISVVPSATSIGVHVTNGKSYRFAVAPANVAGTGQISQKSSIVKAFGRPAQTGAVTAAPNGTTGQVGLRFTDPANNGDPIDMYRVVVESSDGGAAIGARFLSRAVPDTLVEGLTNGKTYRFTVAACNQGTRVDYCGDASPPTGWVVPFGPPRAPSVWAGGVGGVTVRLSWNGSGTENGRPIERVEVRIDGGGWQSVGISGENDAPRYCGASRTIEARVVAGGLTGPSASASANGPNCTVTPYQGPPNPVSSGTCAVGRCSILGASMRGFQPNTGYRVRCNYWPTWTNVTTNGSGDADVLTACYAGNTNVGFIVEGVGSWGQYQVGYAR